MTCKNCGRWYQYAVLVHYPEGGRRHIEDNIFVGDVLVHKADYTNPDLVPSCPFCWEPCHSSQRSICNDCARSCKTTGAPMTACYNFQSVTKVKA